jgi:CheY-like chemotaxis protein
VPGDDLSNVPRRDYFKGLSANQYPSHVRRVYLQYRRNRLLNQHPGQQVDRYSCIRKGLSDRAIRSALDDLALGFELRRSVNGDEALEFLRQSGNLSDALTPSLILLDMNLPRIGGPQVLAAIQADKSIRDIPVVIFSSSRLEADRAKCLALGARQFSTKPDNYAAFVNAIGFACDYVSPEQSPDVRSTPAGA